jgi:hypothetical protein
VRGLRVAGLLLAVAAPSLAVELASPVGAAATPPAPWRVVGLPQQSKPLTRFDVIEFDGRRVLRVASDHAYANLVHALDGTGAGVLTWRWRVDQPVARADLSRRTGDDAALKVCALFDMPLGRVPFLERQLLRIASARTGEKLPTATLCYVWEPSLPDGQLLPNAFTSRLRWIVVHGEAGRWSSERHDLQADFRRAFGDEADTVPPLVGVLVGADTDNTGSQSLGYLADLRLSAAP